MKDSLRSLTDSHENAKYYEEAAQQVFACKGNCTIEVFKEFVDEKVLEKRTRQSHLWQVASTYGQFNKKSLQCWLYQKQKKFQEALVTPRQRTNINGFKDDQCKKIKKHDPGIVCVEWASSTKQYFLVTLLAAGTQLGLEFFRVERRNTNLFKVMIPVVHWLNPDVVAVNEMGDKTRKMIKEYFVKTSKLTISHLVEVPFAPNMKNPYRLTYTVDLKNHASVFKVLFVKDCVDGCG